MNASQNQPPDNTSGVPAPVIPGKILATAFAITALADGLFYDHLIKNGWIIGGFVLVLLGAIWMTVPGSVRQTQSGILSLAVAGLCLRCVYEPTLLAMVLMPIGLMTVALTRREGWTDRVELWIARWVELLCYGWLRSWCLLAITARRALFGNRDGRISRRLGPWIIPVLFGAIFVALFAMANPLISQVLNTFWSWLSGSSIPHPSFDRIFFWLAVSTLLIALLGHKTGIHPKPANVDGIPEPGVADLAMTAILTPAVMIRSLLVFNVLFAIQSVLDLIYLWGGAVLPEGMTYAAYAQRGAYPLIVAALLAGGFVLAAFRPETDATDLRTQRRLVYLWLGQTMLLVFSSVWRLGLYVRAYSLTRLRFSAAVWMLLVAFGLLWIILRIARRKSGRWLVNMNAITTAAVLYLCALTGTDTHIAWFNAKHSEEILGKGFPALDVNYLRGLGDEALPALLWMHQHDSQNVIEQELRDAIWEASLRLNAHVGNWRGWTLRRQLIHAQWSEWNSTLEDMFSFGKVLSVSDTTLVLREYDFVTDKDVNRSYLVTPETEWGNINSISDLRTGDDVVIDYSEKDHRRIITTLVREEIGDEVHALSEEPVGAPTPTPVTVPVVPHVEKPATIATGRVAGLRAGRITILESDPAGGFTNRVYAIAHRVTLHGYGSLADLQLDQRVTCRIIHPSNVPTIIELAGPGFSLANPPTRQGD